MLIGLEYDLRLKALVASYYDTKGSVNFIAKRIPDSELFVWVKSNKITPHRAYNNKYVEKEYTDNINKDRFRIEELFLQYFTQEERDTIHEYNSPQKYFLDIEVDVDEDNTFPKPEIANWPINLLTIVTDNNVLTLTTFDYFKDYKDANEIQAFIRDYFKSNVDYDFNINIKYFETEADLLRTFFHSVLPHIPMIIGWYVVEFDWVTIINRALKCDVDITKYLPSRTLFGRKHIPLHTGIIDYIDTMDKFKPLPMVENLSLDYISNRVLGTKKLNNPYNSMYEFYKKDPYRFTIYNIIDSILVKLIDDDLDLITPSGMVSKISETEINRIFGPVHMSEMFLMRGFYNRGKHLYKKFKFGSGDNKKYQGAFVFEPIPGYYEYIVSFDFSSMYPHIQIEFNISPDSYLGKITEIDVTQLMKGTYVVTENDTVFDITYDSVTKEILQRFYNKRKDANKKIDEIKLFLKNNGIEL